ncbi:hypothetical protein KUCAC02_021835, partial [Chaenocephalus aceratus]
GRVFSIVAACQSKLPSPAPSSRERHNFSLESVTQADQTVDCNLSASVNLPGRLTGRAAAARGGGEREDGKSRAVAPISKLHPSLSISSREAECPCDKCEGNKSWPVIYSSRAQFRKE